MFTKNYYLGPSSDSLRVQEVKYASNQRGHCCQNLCPSPISASGRRKESRNMKRAWHARSTRHWRCYTSPKFSWRYRCLKERMISLSTVVLATLRGPPDLTRTETLELRAIEMVFSGH